MSLLLPLFLAGAGLIVLPIVLHLLRRQPRDRVPFPTLRFLGPHALRDTRRQQILRWLTLLARCALILLVALAFARPFWRRPDTGEHRAVIVAVDNSFSMQAAGRRAALDAWLKQQLASLRDGDRLGVLQLQPVPAWLAPLSDNLEAGRAALLARADGYESSHYAAGLSLAATVLDETPATQRQIILAGDEQKLAWSDVDFERTLPPGIELIAAPSAPPAKTQAGIFNLQASRAPGNRLHLVATVRLFAPDKLKRTVTFYAGGKPLGPPVAVDLAAGQNTPVTADFNAPAATGDLAVRAMLDDDDLPADDTAYAVLPPDNSRRVLLAAAAPGETDFLAHALAAVHGGDLPSLNVAPLPPLAWPPGGVAVLRGPAPFRGDGAILLDKFLDNGGAVWVLCDGSPEQNAWLAKQGVKVSPAQAGGQGALHLRDFDLQHPLFAPFAGRSLAALLEAEFQVGWSLADDDADPLARWPDHTTAIAEIHHGAGRLLVTGFDARRATGDWPLQAAFVPFAHNAIVWLGDGAQTFAQTGRVGQRLTLPGAGQWQSVDSPHPTPARPTTGVIIPDAPGIYAFGSAGQTHLFAVNVDPDESDLAPWPNALDFARLVSKQTRAEDSAAATSIAALPMDRNSQVWWWLLAAAIIVLALELNLANRTVP